MWFFASSMTALLTEWRLLLPLILGAFSIFLLLPRPRPFPSWMGAMSGAAALFLGGLWMARGGGFTIEAFLFYSFAGLSIVGGAMLITQSNPARAALSFTLLVLSVCGLFLLLAAPFLMAASIIIYAGAVIVTFLFVLMLAQQSGPSDADARSREPLLSTLTGFLLLASILFVLHGYQQDEKDPVSVLLSRIDEASRQETRLSMEAVLDTSLERGDTSLSGRNILARGVTMLDNAGLKNLADQTREAVFEWDLARDPQKPLDQVLKQSRDALGKYRAALSGQEQIIRERRMMAMIPERDILPGSRSPVPLSNMSGTAANTPPGEIRRHPGTGVPDLPADNAAFLGRSLFSDYLLAVELGGALLLVATVGAIAIAQRRSVPGERSTAP